MLRNERILSGSPGRLSGRGKGKGVSGGLGSEDERKKEKRLTSRLIPSRIRRRTVYFHVRRGMVKRRINGKN